MSNKIGVGYVEDTTEKKSEDGKKNWVNVTIDGVKGNTFDLALGKGLKR